MDACSLLLTAEEAAYPVKTLPVDPEDSPAEAPDSMTPELAPGPDFWDAPNEPAPELGPAPEDDGWDMAPVPGELSVVIECAAVFPWCACYSLTYRDVSFTVFRS